MSRRNAACVLRGSRAARLARARAGRISVVCSEPSAMRLGTSADSSTIGLTGEDCLVAVRPLSPSGKRPVDRARTSARPLEEWTLLEELWRISHFGWIPEAVIWRALTLAGDREIPTDSLHESAPAAGPR